jgi:hypothetical protein
MVIDEIGCGRETIPRLNVEYEGEVYAVNARTVSAIGSDA